MMHKEETGIYRLFGLLIESEITLPELVTGILKADVLIRFGVLTEQFENPSESGICYMNSIDKFILKVDGVACYLVEKGTNIIIDRNEGGSDDEIRLFLLGSAFGALIHQRGILPFHGSAIAIDHEAVIFSGISGAGKSTLAAGFLKKGYKLLADDFCVITLDNEGYPVAHPGYPQMKLWTDSLENLGHRSVSLKKNKGNFKKYTWPIQPDFCDHQLPVKGIYIISAVTNKEISLKKLTGLEKFNALHENTYRLNYLNKGGTSIAHFNHIEAISQNCFVKSLVRPGQGFYLEKLIELIENDMNI
jgi:hypothetical protein